MDRCDRRNAFAVRAQVKANPARNNLGGRFRHPLWLGLAAAALLVNTLGQSCSAPSGEPLIAGEEEGQVLDYRPEAPSNLSPRHEGDTQPLLFAHAGDELAVQVGQEVVLDGSGSSSPSDAATSFQWQQVAGPAVELLDANAPIARFIAPHVDAAASLEFSLTVRVGQLTATDSVRVEVTPAVEAPATPVLAIHASDSEGPAPLPVTFTANTLNRQALPEEAYSWDLGDGTVATGRQVTHTYTRAAVYTVTLCLTALPIGGDEPICSSTTISVHDLPTANNPPIALSAEYETIEGNPIEITLQALPTTPYTAFSIISEPRNGSLNITAENYLKSARIIYEPAPGFVGEDTFSFRADDGITLSPQAALVRIRVRRKGTLSVSPAGGWTASGSQGGPFSPASAAYTLTNTGGQPIDWTTGKTQSWVSLSKTSGALAPGAADTVTVSINSAAHGLAPGSYNDTVAFTNTTNGNGNTTRAVTLQVAQPVTTELTVPPADRAITLDGVLDPDEWSDAQVYTFDALDTLPPGVVTGGVTASPADTSATLYLKHDPTYLYVGVAVTDDTVVSTASAVWAADVIELFLDHDNSATPDVGFNRMQFLLNAGGQTGSGGANPPDSWQGAAALTADGYGTEFRISKEAFGLTTGAYGFDIAISDVEPVAESIQTRYWCFATANAATNETLWGALDLRPGPGGLTVSPAGGLDATGPVGGPFSPSSVTYTLTNTGGESIQWTAGKTRNWVSLSKTSGTLAAGAQDTVTVTFQDEAKALPSGTHSDTITFTNTTNGNGNATRAVKLTIDAPAGALSVSPAGGWTASGSQGGPFSPASAAYTLTNTGGQPIDWTTGKTQSWVSLSKTSGALAPGAADTVTVSINSAAHGLAPGSYNDTVAFTNTTNSNGSTTRVIALAVTSTGGETPMSTASRTIGVAPLGVFFDAVDDPAEPWKSGVIQPRGFHAQPANITGVRITRVEYGTPLGNGTLTYNSSTRTLQWRAAGQSAGPAVPVAAGRNFALPSGGRSLHVWVDPASLPGGSRSDTIQIVDGGLNADWASFHYEWDFGDPAPQGASPTDPRWYWEHGAKKSDGTWFPKNKAFGWNAAHVYEQAGTYIVTLRVIDDVNGEHRYTQQVTVAAEPPGGWKTYHFAAGGNDAAGDGSQARPFRSWAKARTLAGPNARLLFKRGDTFVVDQMMQPSASATFLIGSYGSGSLPLFQISGKNSFIYGGDSGSDMKIMDLKIAGPYPADNGPGDVFVGGILLALRCEASGMDTVFGSRGVAQDCTFAENKAYGVYVNSSQHRTAALGCHISDANTEWLYRCYGDKCILSHSSFARQMTTKGMARALDCNWFMATFNLFHESASGQGLNLEVQSAPVRHALLSFNVFNALTGRAAPPIGIFSGRDVTISNNRYFGGGSLSFAFVNLSPDPHGYAVAERVKLLHNTVYSASTEWVRFFNVPGGLTTIADWRVANNILVVPHVSSGSSKVVRLVGYAADDPVLHSDFNTWYAPNLSQKFSDSDGSLDLAAWRAAGHDHSSVTQDPRLVAPLSGDLRLQAGSPCTGAGTTAVLPWCRVTADGTPRSPGSVHMGACN